ncbi:MAG TPA: hydrogenase nickel incorporation protein HypB [Ignavibacteria bacterium]|nr:hydrogenase nickel incorporation protein HypB [Ignavibacteria bacterium]HAX48406.1 hydrogenase accessory protein HypB [Bacteroidota bacterium]HRE09695.1 hydrogenase nickel incorporation protein HypB [Ignavibacteria bacterium]HRF65577.1 hydrogenase nickel incorporation protein HypB [Ignavibacteria bacterium]HRJ02927.1 hydrogenase nickel incorporation protein HypB [Ignavibacteria bacterium]
MEIIKIERKVLAKNDAIASEIRGKFEENGVFAINMVSSPGSGKTSLVEKIIEYFNGRVNISVIEGDVQTDLDAQRVSAYNVPVVQIITNGGCHLEANLVNDSLKNLDLVQTDLLIIENVGNLVCPAGYDLGEDMKVVVISVTEGDDKPLKYPKMFINSKVLVINKIDLLPYVNCNIEQLKQNALKINPALQVFEISCTSGEGVGKFCDFLESSI